MAILFFAVLIIAAAVIFSTQNHDIVTLSFITWQFKASLAIVVFLAVLAGMVIMGLLWIGASFKRSMKKKPSLPEPPRPSAGKEGTN